MISNHTRPAFSGVAWSQQKQQPSLITPQFGRGKKVAETTQVEAEQETEKPGFKDKIKDKFSQMGNGVKGLGDRPVMKGLTWMGLSMVPCWLLAIPASIFFFPFGLLLFPLPFVIGFLGHMMAARKQDQAEEAAA